MSAQENAALARSAYDLWNTRRFDQLAALAAPDVQVVNVATGETLRGPEGYRQFAQGWATAFPDAEIEVTNVLASDDGAVVEFTGRGTHRGPLMTAAGPIPPTGRSVHIPFCDVMDIREGKVAQVRSYFDMVTFLRQIGLMPEAAAPTP